ncbi:hypothetical protein ABIA30_005411 [Mycobacterium sp. MAA66]
MPISPRSIGAWARSKASADATLAATMERAADNTPGDPVRVAHFGPSTNITVAQAISLSAGRDRLNAPT